MKGLLLVFLAVVAAISAITKAKTLHDNNDMERMKHVEQYPSYRVKRQNPMDQSGGPMTGMQQAATQFKPKTVEVIPGSEAGTADQVPFPKPELGGAMG